MLYRAVRRPGWLITLTLLGGSHTAAAEDDAVRIRCDTLAADDAAQVEARIRATLLSVLGNVSVRIECAAGTATVTVVADERTEFTQLPLPDNNSREALLDAVERTLEALEQRAPETVRPPPQEPPRGHATTAAPVTATSAGTEPRPSSVSAPPRPAPTHWALGAGVLAEIWGGDFAYGARLMSEYRRAPWSLGASFGWLTTPSMTDVFRAHELHAFAFGALEERRTTGLRGSLGIGMSVLTIFPEPDIVVRTATTLPLVFLATELARPVRFGHGRLLPALELRLFPGRREVTVDGSRRLVLPPLCPALFVGLGYEI